MESKRLSSSRRIYDRSPAAVLNADAGYRYSVPAGPAWRQFLCFCEAIAAGFGRNPKKRLTNPQFGLIMENGIRIILNIREVSP